ncbi:hypothetical protein Dimus_002413 [Dionaea muscipula]
MSTASSHYRFLANALYPATYTVPRVPRPVAISCSSKATTAKEDDHHHHHHHPVQIPGKVEHRLAKLAMAALAAGVLTLGCSVQDVSAAKSGGRVGGQAFRSSAPRYSSPRIDNSRTNIYVNPPVAPPLVGGYGFGFGSPFYGGWGWTPFSFFVPGPSVAVGIGGGFELFAFFLVLGAVGAVIRRFLGPRDQEDD